MQIIDNINHIVKNDLQENIRAGSKLSIAAACFSIYAYQELKKQLEGIDELRFIFTSPTFVTEKASKAQREFYIPRISRERSLYGTEFEVKLRNELTQKAVARECADWIKHKAVFKSNVTQEQMMGFMTVDGSTYMPINGFTTVDLGCERGNNAYYPVQKTESYENANYFLKLFEQLWNDKNRLQEVTDVVIENISAAYRENAPEYIYFVALYNIFNEFLDDISEDELPNEATGFKESKIWGMLYNFQRDAVLAIISKLEKFNGCILADSVGLGKTFTALAVIKYYENRNKSVLVLCPKKLSENWNTYKGNYINNPIATDRLRYDVLYHTDLSREHGQSNGIDLDRLNWGNYDLVVIDESHNFRNGGEVSGEDAKENRYLKLLNKVVRAGVRTKVLMLSATPVNNKFIDLKNQLALAYEGDASQMNKKLDTTKSIDEIFRQAQKAFNAWSKLPADERTTDELLRTLDFDFFELLDSVTIARSRKHIEKYYNTSDIGKFPERLPPISLRPCLTDLNDAINYNDIYNLLMSLSLTIYTPSNYIMPSKLAKYIDITHHKGNSLTQQGREEGIRRLMSINLLKRLESSVASFRLTIDRIKKLINDTIGTIKNYQSGDCVLNLTEISGAEDFDYDDQNTDFFSVGKKIKIDLADMDYVSWMRELEKDAENLELLSVMIADITPEHDTKLQTLFDLIRKKIEQPINPGNKKIIIFTAFSDTADYLFANVSKFAKENFGLETAEITGTVDGNVSPSGKAFYPPEGRQWAPAYETYLKLKDDNRLWFGENGTNVPRQKQFLSEIQSGIVPTSILFYSECGHNQEAKKELISLMSGIGNSFETPKPTRLLRKVLGLVNLSDDDIILDFFSGSATTAHAVMQLNAEDGGHRKFIMVQLPEPCDEASEACKAGYKNICEIGKERIRRAGEKLLQDVTSGKGNIKGEGWGCGMPTTQEDRAFAIKNILDIGFRVLKLDDTNMKDVYYAPDDYDQNMLAGLESNIKDDRTDLDLLFGCLIDWGLPLSLPYKSEQLGGCTVHTYNDGDLIACFDTDIPESVVKEIAQRRPLRAVFQDSGFASSPEKINVFEIFKLYMPEDANDISKRVRVI